MVYEMFTALVKTPRSYMDLVIIIKHRKLKQAQGCNVSICHIPKAW